MERGALGFLAESATIPQVIYGLSQGLGEAGVGGGT